MTETYHSTKYDSAAHEVIAELADVATGYGIEASGNAEAPTGYFALVVLDSTCDLDFSDHTNYPVGDYVGEVARTYGVTEADVTGSHIATWDERGFVYVETLATPELARAEFDARAERYATWDNDATEGE